MLKIVIGNIAILALALLYWFIVDYIYAKNYELYRPVEWLIQLSFLVFTLICFDYNSKALVSLEQKKRLTLSLLIPVLLTLIFMSVLYLFGIDFHVWVGYLLYSD